MFHVPYFPRYVLWGDDQLSRPTTSFARGCKLWSRERQFYEDERHSNMAEFWNRPYLCYQYPNIDKHYPGTWRVVRRNGKELEEIVARLIQPTQATTSRAQDIKEHTTQFRLIDSREKAKDIVVRARSAGPRLQTNPRKSPDSSKHGSRSGSGFCPKSGKRS